MAVEPSIRYLLQLRAAGRPVGVLLSSRAASQPISTVSDLVIYIPQAPTSAAGQPFSAFRLPAL